MSEILESASNSKVKRVHVQPTIMLDSTDLPEIKNYDVGMEYDAIIHCKMISKHEGPESFLMPGEDADDSDIVRGRFKILSIRPKNSTDDNSSDKMRVIKKKSSEY